MGIFCPKQQNPVSHNIKSPETIEEQITAENVIFNKTSNIKAPKINYDKEWVLNLKNSSLLNESLTSFMDEILILEGYFSTSNDNDLELSLKLLKQKGLDLLKESFNEIINKDFKNKCENIFEKLFNSNIISINTFSEKLASENKEESRKIYIKKYEREITNIKNNKNINEIKYFTVLVIGKSGVGKSCLINNILKLEIPLENKQKRIGIDGAIEKKGGFVTKENEIYISDKVSGIRCIDTPGCDLNGHDVQQTIKDCQKEINKQYNDGNDPSNYVSIIWYCFSGNRFDDESDVELIKKIRETYTENQIPVIIVKTEAYDDEDTEKFKKMIEKKNLKTDYIGVIAKKKFEKKKKNLNKLVELSITNIQKALNGKFFKVLSKEIRECLIKNLKNENEKINKFAKEQMILYFIKHFTTTLDDNNFFKFIDNLLNICFSLYSVEFKENEISDDIIKIFNEFIIKNFVEQAIKEYISLSMKEVNKILEEKSLLLLDLQVVIQKRNKSNINTENLNTRKDFEIITRNFLCENLFYVAQKILIKLILEKVLFPLCDFLNYKYNKDVDELVNDDKVQQLIKETYQFKFEELKQRFNSQKGSDNINQLTETTPD